MVDDSGPQVSRVVPSLHTYTPGLGCEPGHAATIPADTAPFEGGKAWPPICAEPELYSWPFGTLSTMNTFRMV